MSPILKINNKKHINMKITKMAVVKNILMLFSLILISIEKPGTKIKMKNAYFNFDLKWVNVTLLLHFFENHPNAYEDESLQQQFYRGNT